MDVLCSKLFFLEGCCMLRSVGTPLGMRRTGLAFRCFGSGVQLSPSMACDSSYSPLHVIALYFASRYHSNYALLTHTPSQAHKSNSVAVAVALGSGLDVEFLRLVASPTIFQDAPKAAKLYTEAAIPLLEVHGGMHQSHSSTRPEVAGPRSPG